MGQGIRTRMSIASGNGSGGGGIPAPGAIDTVVYHTVTAPELAAKQFNLPTVPPDLGKVCVDMHQGPAALLNTIDFNLAGLVFDWNGFGLDGLIAVGDVVRIFYNSLGGVPIFAGLLDTVVYHTVTGGEAAAKSFALPSVPPDTGKLVVDVHQGPAALVYNTDYTTVGAAFNWTGLGLDGLLVAGDTVRIVYNSM